MRGLYALPLSALRALAGRPVVLDGQVLDVEAQIALRGMALDPTPSFETLPIEEARAAIRHEAAMFAGLPIPVGRVVDTEVAGADGPLRARRYLPAHSPDPGATLVFFHGGGWTVGDLDTHDQTCRFLAAHSGVQVVAVDYRLAPEHPFPAAIDDALAAFRDVVARGADWGIDPARVAVGGDSAGASLSAVTANLAAADGGPAPAFQLLIYPATDAVGTTRSHALFADGFFLTEAQMVWYYDQFLPPGIDRSDPRVSPLRQPAEALRGVAPAYVVTAGFDPLRDEGEAYAALLRDAGVPVALRRHRGLIHGFANLVGFGRAGRLAMAEAAGAVALGLRSRTGADAERPAD